MNSSLEQYPIWLKSFIATYENLSTDNLDTLLNIYHKDINFIDPIHELRGLGQLTDYFDGLYENILSCDFEIHNVLHSSDQASVFWSMTYRHSKFNKRLPILVEGTSLIKGQDDKVIYHRDYLDLGAMIYEQLPVIGKVIKFIKAKASQ